jgi:hypothetical protein
VTVGRFDAGTVPNARRTRHPRRDHPHAEKASATIALAIAHLRLIGALHNARLTLTLVNARVNPKDIQIARRRRSPWRGQRRPLHTANMAGGLACFMRRSPAARETWACARRGGFPAHSSNSSSTRRSSHRRPVLYEVGALAGGISPPVSPSLCLTSEEGRTQRRKGLCAIGPLRPSLLPECSVLALC